MGIKEIREEKGITQKQMSEELGIPVRTLQDWEAGKRKPPAYVMSLILKASQDKSTECNVCTISTKDLLEAIKKAHDGINLDALSAISDAGIDTELLIKPKDTDPDYNSFIKVAETVGLDVEVTAKPSGKGTRITSGVLDDIAGRFGLKTSIRATFKPEMAEKLKDDEKTEK